MAVEAFGNMDPLKILKYKVEQLNLLEDLRVVKNATLSAAGTQNVSSFL